MGSWKIIEILFPRISRMREAGSSRMLVSSKKIEPFTIRPGGSGINRIMDRAVTDLPQPDSPKTPRVLDRGISRLTRPRL